MAVVAVAKIEQDVYAAVRTLIIDNKPTYTRTILGTSTTFTYDVVSEYPKDNPTFPVVVLNESDVNVTTINQDGSGEEFMVEIQLDFYAKEAHGKKAISEGRDPLRNTFIGNKTAFDTDNGLIPMEDFWDNSSTSAFTDRNQLINTGSVIVKFMLK